MNLLKARLYSMLDRRFVLLGLTFMLPVMAVARNCTPAGQKPVYETWKIFPLVREHVHGSTVVVLPNGDLLAAWFQGSGERWADDVAIMGARLRKGSRKWTRPFVMADVAGFPDINPAMFIDPRGRLWLVWYTVIANQWETSLLKYRISADYQQEQGPPKWAWQDDILVKPGGSTERGIQPDDRFVQSVRRQIDSYTRYIISQTPAGKVALVRNRAEKWAADLLAKAAGKNMMRKGYLYGKNGRRTSRLMGYPYFRRMGWQTKNKAVIVDNRRIIIPLYSDGFSFSLMAITDDFGAHWQFSEPLVAGGNIQPSIAFKADGTLVAYMRDNGPPPQRLHIAESHDKGMSWSDVRDSKLPNPGSGADIVTLQNGHWVLAYNDTEDGRYSLAVSLSVNEGKSWDYTGHLERDLRKRNIATTGAYPAIVQGPDGMIHVVYSYNRHDQPNAAHETIKYARFNEAWLCAQ